MRTIHSSTLTVVCAMNAAFCFGDQQTDVQLAKPTPQQVEWHDFEIGMFIHFAPNTWLDKEYDDLSLPLEKMNPTQLDTDQWVAAAEAMGAKYIVFVAKHVGGFCMWQTDTTDYSVKSIPWRDGKGDVLADLAESCRKRGIKLGVYLSPCDRKHGAGVGGRCGSPEAQERYNELYRQQLTEVLTRYGEMVEVWFDGSNVIEVGDILKKHAPRAMVFQGPHATIRWVGNEAGFAPDPGWNSVSAEAAKSGVATARHGDPSGEAWLPNECDARIRANWFWNRGNARTLKSVDQLMEMYYCSVGHGAVLLLNHTQNGKVHDATTAREGRMGGALKLDGCKSFVDLGNGPLFLGDFTLAAWLHPTPPDTAGLRIILSKETCTVSPNQCRFYLTGDRRIGMQLCGATGHGLWPFESRTAVSAEQWSHVAVTRSGDRFTIYHNGDVVGQKKPAGAIRHQNTTSLKLGTVFDPSGTRLNVFDGLIDDVRVYNRALTADDVSRLAELKEPSDMVDSVPAWQWSPENIDTEWSTVEIDIIPFCNEAKEYRVEFRKTDGRDDLEIRSLVAVFGGRRIEEYVQRAGNGNTFHVNVPGLGIPLKLEAVVRGKDGRETHGRVLVTGLSVTQRKRPPQ